MFKTIKSILTSFFLVFAFIPVLILGLENIYDKKEEKLDLISKEISDIHILQLENNKLVSDFLSYELINPDFYVTSKSPYIEKHLEQQQIIREKIMKLSINAELKDFGHERSLLRLLDNQFIYSTLVVQLADIQRERGFKDFGVEGKMRDEIHILMSRKDLDQVDVLMCRRHEKDYIIRNDISYADKLHRKVNEIFLSIEQNRSMKTKAKDTIREILNNYINYFDDMVKYDQELGLRSNTGLKGKIDSTANNIEYLFDTTIQEIEQKRIGILAQYRILVSITIIIIICIAIIASFYIARRLTCRLSLLTSSMRNLVESDFEDTEDAISKYNSNDEIGNLLSHYSIMKSKIIELIYDFKRKVHERTLELEERNVRIEKQNEEIMRQHDELLASNTYMEEQQLMLEKQNHEILDSLRYAAGIQQAMMPDNTQILDIFSDFFIIYKPLGIVSGDFYWTYRLVLENGVYDFFIVADCTGHGVPGALMSMLGISFLNDLVIQRKITSPALLLQRLKENVIYSQKRNHTRSKISDGMDIAIGVIHEESHTLTFAGANRSLIVISGDELVEYSANKQSVSRSFDSNDLFQEQIIHLKENDHLYVFTDGYSDQFGGPENKKFTKRRLKELLFDISDKSMIEQKNILTETFDNWKACSNQIDDVLVFGIHLSA